MVRDMPLPPIVGREFRRLTKFFWFGTDGVEAPHRGESPSAKTVQFDLGSHDGSPGRKDIHSSDDDGSGDSDGDNDERGRRHGRRRSDKHRRRDGSADSAASDETIDLPPRFDEYGRRKGEDPMADKLEDFLHGRGTAGRMFERITGDLFSSGRRR